jgi:hypothetical protein
MSKSVHTHLLAQVGALELNQFDGCLGWPKKVDRSNLRPLLSRYYEFWDGVHLLLRMEHVYMFVTGKQTAFCRGVQWPDDRIKEVSNSKGSVYLM